MMKLVSCAAAVALLIPAVARAQRGTGEEVLLGARLIDNAAIFRVKSDGCTKKSDFGVITVKNHPLTVKLVRIHPDYCQARLPAGTTIQFNFSEMGVRSTMNEEVRRELVILNPIEPYFQNALVKSK